jgi:anti-sigma B factor antagonist
VDAGPVTPLIRPGEFDLRVHAQEDCHTLSLAGELDLVTAPELQATISRLCKDGAREIVLDLHELAFIDSTGLRVILSGSRLCESHGCDFSLSRVQPPAQHLFELTGVVGRLSFRGRALARRLSRRGPATERMPVDLFRPDFEISLDLDHAAPRSARNYVRDLVGVDAPEHLHQAVTLLTSELVTRTVLQRTSRLVQAVELRVWLRPHLVRVELRVPSELLSRPSERGAPDYDHIVLDQVADRWSLDCDQGMACAWFEIDRDRARANRTRILGAADDARSVGGPPHEEPADLDDDRTAQRPG